MLEYAGLNYLAILVATLAAFLIGGVWYGPAFGKAWMAALGKTEKDLSGPAKPMIISFFTSFITAHPLALLVNTLDITTVYGGVVLGLYAGIGLIAMGMASDYAFCGWPPRLYLIQAGYRVVYAVVMGVILALWR